MNRGDDSSCILFVLKKGFIQERLSTINRIVRRQDVVDIPWLSRVVEYIFSHFHKGEVHFCHLFLICSRNELQNELHTVFYISVIGGTSSCYKI